ncbi:MAG: hypothetical protein KAJ95_08765, partial [Gammaproteobacteria bacterium]|nr:hypothetical protein [Gammaproteobacteria bacterium]
MSIVRWLLCHLIIITLLVSLSLGYVFRDSLKEDFNRLTGKVNSPEKIEKPPVQSDSTKKITTDGANSASLAKTKEYIRGAVDNTQESNKPLQHQYPQVDTNQYSSQQQYNAVPESTATDVKKANDPWGQVGSSQRDTDNAM